MKIFFYFFGGLQSEGGTYVVSSIKTSSISRNLSFIYRSLCLSSRVFDRSPVFASYKGSGDGDLISGSFDSKSQTAILFYKSSILCLLIQISISKAEQLDGKKLKHCGVKVLRCAGYQPLFIRLSLLLGSSQRLTLEFDCTYKLASGIHTSPSV